MAAHCVRGAEHPVSADRVLARSLNGCNACLLLLRAPPPLGPPVLMRSRRVRKKSGADQPKNFAADPLTNANTEWCARTCTSPVCRLWSLSAERHRDGRRDRVRNSHVVPTPRCGIRRHPPSAGSQEGSARGAEARRSGAHDARAEEGGALRRAVARPRMQARCAPTGASALTTRQARIPPSPQDADTKAMQAKAAAKTGAPAAPPKK